MISSRRKAGIPPAEHEVVCSPLARRGPSSCKPVASAPQGKGHHSPFALRFSFIPARVRVKGFAVSETAEKQAPKRPSCGTTRCGVGSTCVATKPAEKPEAPKKAEG